MESEIRERTDAYIHARRTFRRTITNCLLPLAPAAADLHINAVMTQAQRDLHGHGDVDMEVHR